MSRKVRTASDIEGALTRASAITDALIYMDETTEPSDHLHLKDTLAALHWTLRIELKNAQLVTEQLYNSRPRSNAKGRMKDAN